MPHLRICFLVVLLQSYSYALDTTIRWGSHKGSASPLHDGLSDAPLWNANPSTVQLLQDFAGTALLNSTGGPSTAAAWSKGDRIELGFFASSLGADNAIGGTAGNADTPATTLFQGTWVALTSQTYIGQDWGTNSGPPDEVIDAGDFMFLSKYTYNTGSSTWNSSVVHNNTVLNDDETGYKITTGVDTPTNLTDQLSVLTNSTPIGIRFYDLDTTGGGGTSIDSDGTTRYNTIMNTNWTWPGTNGDLDMFLHDSTNEDTLNSNLVFEFDNTTYGSGASSDSRAFVDGTIVSSHGTAGDLHSTDFKTSITYYSGTADLNLKDAGVGDVILSGLDKADSTNTISGGNNNMLTINANAAGSSYEFSGTIQDDSSGNTGLKILKVGSGEQILTGNIDLSNSANSYVNLHQGTLTFDPGSGKNQVVEYLTGSGTLKLDNTSNAAQTIQIGLANTTSKKTFSGNITLSGSGTNTVNVGGGEFAGFDKHQEFSGAVSGAANLKKTGSGKLTLSGNNNFSGGVTIADGGGTKDGGILVAGHANALGSGTTVVEHGKLAISAGTTVTTTIQGQATNDNTNMKSVIGGGVGNSAGVIDNFSGTQINIGSADGQIDVLSPGMAQASSMSNGTSDFQAVAGNHDASGNDDLTLSIGTIQIDKIGLKNGGVFEWEITDFAGNNSDGSDWDVLKFDNLEFSESDSFDINIYSLASNGSAGGVTVDGSNHLYSSKTGTSGFKFMEWTTSGSGWDNAPGSARVVNGFNINSDNWAVANNFYYGDWSVWYESGSFYLQYSAVPEPSTYFMVTGLLMLPGYNFLRRIRKKKSFADVEDITDNA